MARHSPKLTNRSFMVGLGVSRPTGLVTPYTRLSGGLLRVRQEGVSISNGSLRYEPSEGNVHLSSGFAMRLGVGLIFGFSDQLAVVTEFNCVGGLISETLLGYRAVRVTLAVAPWNFGFFH